MKAHLFEKRIRHFGSALEAALFQDNIPVAVYKQLLADVHRSLPTLHRYLALRKRMLGARTSSATRTCTCRWSRASTCASRPDEARAITLEALAPLGTAYTEALRKGFDSRWTDYLPSTGKRVGRVLDGRLRRAPVSSCSTSTAATRI